MIIIKTTNTPRYPTRGDYYKEDGNYIIEVHDTGTQIYNHLVAIHELVEFICAEYKGIDEKTIYEFDNVHLDSDEPGALKESPYRREHVLAENIERQICHFLNIDYDEYYKTL